MAVPRNRVSNARKNSRRSHHAKVKKIILACECGKPRLTHRRCTECGVYAGKASSASDQS